MTAMIADYIPLDVVDIAPLYGGPIVATVGVDKVDTYSDHRMVWSTNGVGYDSRDWTARRNVLAAR